MEEAYKKINGVLVDLINEIWDLERRAIITEEFKDLSNNDMHVIEAVGLGEGKNMSAIAFFPLFLFPSFPYGSRESITSRTVSMRSAS